MELKDNHKVLRKMRAYDKYVTEHNGVGTKPRGLILNYNNACNFKCQQCFTESPNKPVNGKITLEMVKKLADEADALGMYETLLEGGEPLVCKDLYDIIKIFGADRFYIEMTTNGYLLTDEVAKKLADAGMSRVSVSLDSMNPKEHDMYRGIEAAFEHAMKALDNIKRAGMRAAVNFLVGHYNIMTQETKDICEFCKDNGYHLNLVLATPTGNWKGKYEVMATPEDVAYLEELRNTYKNIWRDIWPALPNKKVKVSGCIAVNRLYINPYGDVLPCSYLHMKLGNIYDKPLKEILDYGFSFPCFAKTYKGCYAGEDPSFMKKYCTSEMSILNPIEINKIIQ